MGSSLLTHVPPGCRRDMTVRVTGLTNRWLANVSICKPGLDKTCFGVCSTHLHKYWGDFLSIIKEWLFAITLISSSDCVSGDFENSFSTGYLTKFNMWVFFKQTVFLILFFFLQSEFFYWQYKMDASQQWSLGRRYYLQYLLKISKTVSTCQYWPRVILVQTVWFATCKQVLSVKCSTTSEYLTRNKHLHVVCNTSITPMSLHITSNRGSTVMSAIPHYKYDEGV